MDSKNVATDSPIMSKSYSQDEAFQETLKYFNGDDLAARVWVNKYALKDSYGNIFEQTPDDMHWRLAKEISRIEQKYKNPVDEQRIYQLLKDFKYIVPQGGPMTGIGNEFQIASLSNCFVVGNEGNSDSYGGILKVDQEQVQLMKRRGGVGHDLSHIRPKGSPVKNSALTSTGIVPFMERYSNSTREVAQDGRRGALMLSVSIKHPDSEKFIDAKLEQGKVTGANVSVKIHDDFMRAVENEIPYHQQYPIDSDHPIYTRDTDAGRLWQKIVHNAWKSAEPGILFWDTIIRESVPDCYADLGYKTVSTNPCGEIPLCPYDSCRLLAINLYSYVEKPFTPEARFNFKLFKEHVVLAQRLMDDIIDLELEKIDAILGKIDADPEDEEIKHTERRLWEKIQTKAREGRRTGVGITAEGDMLAALGLRYGTEAATDFSEEIHKTLAVEAYRSSVIMAKERGAFKIYDAEREAHNPMIGRLR
ncbi:MAG: ribonucleotide reductase N-terminal alpha domain-containing protein, partial [Prolixibacteraceae bacterium]